MFPFFTWVLLLDPFTVVELSIERSVFPKEAENWDRIGFFKLKDGENQRLVLLYCYDTDSIAEKQIGRGKMGSFFYPNVFLIHALYKNAAGKWIHKEVISFGRVRFMKVTKATLDEVVLELCPNFRILIKPGEDLAKVVKRAAEINKPFTKSLSFVNGILTAK